MSRSAARALGSALAALLGCSAAVAATEVRFFRLQSRSAFLAGTFDGVSVDDVGRLALADRVERVGQLEEPFLFSAAAHPEGWVVGTGNAGRVLLVSRAGQVRTLFEAPEPEIFAVWADGDGTVFAGSSPEGKVYRIAGDAAEVYFDPGETYIWALERGPSGELLVATGTTGRLYRVTGRDTGEVFFDSEDTHIRTVRTLPDGGVLAGTAGEGLILRIGEAGEARTLFDAPQPEIVDLSIAEDGTCYAAVLASEASLTDLSASGQAAKTQSEQQEEGSEGEAQVVVSVGGGDEGQIVGSRPAAYQGPRSEIVRISPRGRAETLWQFDAETVYTIRWHRGRLWVGTGLEGKLYSFRDRRMVLEKDVDERQVVALLEDAPGPAFATANATALYRLSGARERQGSFTSPALDAGQIAEFGTLRWQGAQPAGTEVRFAFRSGTSSDPDRTWSPWTPGAAGSEVALTDVPAGRYLQWRAELRGDGDSPQLTRVTVSYRQLNLPPRVEAFTALDPGEILVPANFNPANQVFEPAHPNREGIFTTLQPEGARPETARKTLWKRGFQTLRWQASDPNGDELEAALAFRPEGSEEEWLPVADELTEPFYSFDATALPDGVYRFRLTLTDRGGGDPGRALGAEEVSEPVLIDHTPARLVRVDRREGGFRVVAEDGLNPLRQVEFSVDAGEWKPARPKDGLVDGRSEELYVEAPPDARLVLLRLTDAAFNVATYDLLREAR